MNLYDSIKLNSLSSKVRFGCNKRTEDLDQVVQSTDIYLEGENIVS